MNTRTIMAWDSSDWALFLSGSGVAKAIDIGIDAFKIRLRRRTAASESIHTTVKIYNALQSIPTHQCTRRTIMKAHNGGKVLDARTHKYASVLYEDQKEPFRAMIDEVQGWRIDDSYARMLAKMVQQREMHLHTETMEPGRLKDLYESEGVRLSCLYFIGEDGYNLYYASFASHLPISHFDTHTRTHILNAMDKITKYLKF